MRMAMVACTNIQPKLCMPVTELALGCERKLPFSSFSGYAIWNGTALPAASTLPNPPHVDGRQSRFQLVPRGSRVARLIDRALRPTIDQREHMPPPLVSRCIHNVRIHRIQRHIDHTRVLADRQHGLPVLPAI